MRVCFKREREYIPQILTLPQEREKASEPTHMSAFDILTFPPFLTFSQQTPKKHESSHQNKEKNKQENKKE